MSENKTAKTPTDSGVGFIDGVWYGPGPTAWQCQCGKPYTVTCISSKPTKREWVGLTDEQVEDEWERITGHSIFGGDRSEGRVMYISPDEVIELSRAIEAKLKEKNGGEYRNGATTERTKLKEKNA
jgi:hypothetical protein